MDTNILVSTFLIAISKGFYIGVHDGIFHADDMLAVAFLSILNASASQIIVVRTRNVEFLNKCDINVDVGGGEFDHHQKGGNGCRQNGIPYASAGLVWKRYGLEIIKMLSDKYSITDYSVSAVFDAVDKKFIQKVDSLDNGIPSDSTFFSFISSCLPKWFEENKTGVYEAKFKKVLDSVIDIITELILDEIAFHSSLPIIEEAYKQITGNVICIPSPALAWENLVIEINEKNPNKQVDFVIFECINGNWAARCVPPSKEKLFEQRISFPASWAGQSTKLPNISGIPGAIFAHNNRFFVKASTEEEVRLMCELATRGLTHVSEL